MDLKKYTESILESTRESTTGLEFDLRFDIVNFIKAKLKETGDTQRSLALKMKMKDSQLTRIMNAETNITLETVARIYHAFNARPTIQTKFDHANVASVGTVFIEQAVTSVSASKVNISHSLKGA